MLEKLQIKIVVEIIKRALYNNRLAFPIRVAKGPVKIVAIGDIDIDKV